jgi:plastocyanin
MRRLLVPVALVALALAAAACTGSAGPAWTYAPPTPAPASQPAPSGAPTAAPSGAPASAAPSEAPSGGGGGGGGTVVQISALNIQFEQTEVSAPADTPFTIHFNNKDASIPHDVVIKDSAGMIKFQGDLTTGPQEIDYPVPALAAGSYTFVCSVHPNMTGTLKVGS